VHRLHEALRFADRLTRAIDFDDVGGEMWDAIYEPLSEAKPGLLGGIIARGEAHVIRLAEMYAVLDLSDKINAPHLLAALAVWDYAEASTRHVFGEALGDPDQDAVLAAVHGAPTGLTTDELRDHFQRHWSADRLRAATLPLVETGLLTAETLSTGGRPATRYRACSPAKSRPAGYLAIAHVVSDCAVSAVRPFVSSKPGPSDPGALARKVPGNGGSIRPDRPGEGLTAQFPRGRFARC
jgi:hypothetical protein